MQLDKATSALCQNVPFLCPGWGSSWWVTVYCQNPFLYSNFCCSVHAECSQGARLVFHRKVGAAQQHLRAGFLLTLPCLRMTAHSCLRTAPVYIFPNAAEKGPCSLLNPHGMGPHTAKETTASESGSQSPRECYSSPSVPFVGGGRIWSRWLSQAEGQDWAQLGVWTVPGTSSARNWALRRSDAPGPAQNRRGCWQPRFLACALQNRGAT